MYGMAFFYSFNRTIVELRRALQRKTFLRGTRFNRTIVELRPAFLYIALLSYFSFNRTIVELRLMNLLKKQNFLKIVLIEP